MTYGLEVPSDLHTRLRGLVPAKAVAWVEEVTGIRVLRQTPLVGGTSAAVHRLVLADQQEVVLRRFVLDWIAEEPWAPTNEATVLTLLRSAPVPSPNLIAVDPDGAAADAPAVLMTSLPGQLVWDPPDQEPWLRAMVELMTTLHRQPVGESLRPWAPYPPEGVPPPWSRHRAAWQEAIRAWGRGHPPGDDVFLHRDFHPGNVLWEGGEVAGLVDWVSSCAGPAEEDVAHCRLNLALHHGQDTADRFLDLWLEATGRTEYDPYFDLVDVVSMGGPDPNDRLDSFVAAAAARL